MICYHRNVATGSSLAWLSRWVVSILDIGPDIPLDNHPQMLIRTPPRLLHRHRTAKFTVTWTCMKVVSIPLRRFLVRFASTHSGYLD
jgi:hypothetical protein